jgi:RNA polymerase sigma-70 factor, ECF subfamily
MNPERPFQELAAHLDQADPEAARLVFDRYARRLVGLVAARLPDSVRPKVEAEDVVQSVFRTFFRRHGAGQFHFDSWDQLWTLLTVLAVRKASHHVEKFRAAARDVRREQPAGHADDSSGGFEVAGPSPSPAEGLLLTETLQQVLADLKERDRPAVVLRLQGFSVAEISEQLRCTERTVQRILERVRAHLEVLAAAD